MSKESIRVYAACLSSYNNGRLHGEWIDVSDDEDELKEKIQEMLKASPETNAEEWAFHDTEGPGSSLIGEYSSTAEVCALAALADQHDAALIRAAKNISATREELIETLERSEGSADTANEWAEERAYELDELTDAMPTKYLRAIDWDIIVHEYECEGFRFSREDGSVYVFNFSY